MHKCRTNKFSDMPILLENMSNMKIYLPDKERYYTYITAVFGIFVDRVIHRKDSKSNEPKTLGMFARWISKCARNLRNFWNLYDDYWQLLLLLVLGSTVAGWSRIYRAKTWPVLEWTTMVTMYRGQNNSAVWRHVSEEAIFFSYIRI